MCGEAIFATDVKLLQILSEDGHFFLMEAKLSLCHLPESFDEYDGTLDATEHMDTVLRYVTRPVLGQYLVE